MRYFLTSLLCVLTLSLTAQETVTYPYNPDSDNDAFVASTDLLELLGLYGDEFSPAEIMIGDTGLVQWIQLLSQTLQSQQEFINQLQSDYIALPDGIFSGDILRWNGTEWIPESPPVDECGVPNGDNSTCTDECGIPNGDNSTCTDNCGVVNGTNECISCGDAINHEGYDYSTVLIGEQCWFSENCRYLPEVSYTFDKDYTEPIYYVYGYEGTDVAAAQATDNYETYGVLYNWPAVMTEGICPSGWHTPSDDEWTQLTDFLGGESVAGYAMKSTSGWTVQECLECGEGWNDDIVLNGSNSSGFTGLPGGSFYSSNSSYNSFDLNGNHGNWWSSSESGNMAGGLRLTNESIVAYGVNSVRANGYSARCVIDYTDECGVPNGDNSTCSDECGVPNGDNSTCAGCAGVPNSGLVYDDCEVCGGDNSTCSDECGVPNGDNSTCLDECGVLNGDNSTCADDCGVPYGDNSTCTDNCGVVNGTNDCIACGEDIGHEGYDYSTVLIGEQCWFSENCRYLPEVSPLSASFTSYPIYYVFDYEGTDVTAAQATSNYETYGVLYNWPAVMTEGICPSGWHIPSDGEFTELTDFLGGEGVAGGKMKEAGYAHWYSPNEGATNSSGFTGLPGGYRYAGGFNNDGFSGEWWSASESGSYSWGRELSYSNDDVYRSNVSRNLGFSARCVIDYTDDCGVLNGDNSTCLDDCGIPNGDNSTCLDECGVPNGDNTTCSDDCGVPNGDNSSCTGCTDITACNFNPNATVDDGSCVTDSYGLDVDVVMAHTEGVLAGQTTYRLYVTTPHTDDFLSAVYGDIVSPLNISTSTSFYQHAFGEFLGSSMNPGFYESFHELEYDSWVTIGLEEEPGTGEQAPFLTYDFPYADFENGGNLQINNDTGGALYVTNPATTSNAFSDVNQRILVAQLTTDGTPSGAIFVQMLNHGDLMAPTIVELTFNGTTGTCLQD